MRHSPIARLMSWPDAQAPSSHGSTRIRAPLARANVARDGVSLSLRYVPARIDVLAVRAVVIGGLDGSLHRAGDVRRLVRFHSLQDDLLALDDLVEAEMSDRRTTSQLEAQRALRSRDQRELGLPDSGKRTQTPTRPAGSGSPRADPMIWCCSDMLSLPGLQAMCLPSSPQGYPRPCGSMQTRSDVRFIRGAIA